MTVAGIVLGALSIVLLAPIALAQSHDAGWAHCNDANVNLRIGGCTAVIQHGGETTANLAIAFSNRALAYNDKGQYDRAIQDYDEAIRLNPNFAIAFNGRGNGYNSEGHYDRAIQDYDQAIRLRPDYALAFNGRGNAYNSQGQYDRAIQDYAQATHFDPNFADAFNGQGNAYHSKGQHDRAIQDFSEAIRLRPDYALAFNGRGSAYNDKGQQDRAIQDFNEAIRLNPRSAYGYNNRGTAYARKGQPDRAIQDYDQAILLNPGYSDAFINRAYTKFHTAAFADATNDLRQSLTIDASQPYAVLWLHLVNQLAGQDDAADFAQRAGHVDPAKWPAPVVRFYLGEMPSDQMVLQARDPDANTEKTQRCEASFFLGEHLVLEQQTAEGLVRLKDARDNCPQSDEAYWAARAEITRLAK